MSKKLEEHIVKTNRVYPLVCENIPYVKEDNTYMGKGVICVLITDSLNSQNGGEGEAVILSGGNAGDNIRYTHEVGEAAVEIGGGLGSLYGLGANLSIKFPGKDGDYVFGQTIQIGRKMSKFETLSDKECFNSISGVTTVGEIMEWAEMENARYEKDAKLSRDAFTDYGQSYEDMESLMSGAWKEK